MKHKHIISMLVEDSPGVLTKIAGLFARRGFNIDTITVGKTITPNVSKIIISLTGQDGTIEQVEKQCNKLVDVIKVNEIIPEESFISEMCLIKVGIKNDKQKEEIIKYSEIYDAKIMDITQKFAIIRAIGQQKRIEGLIDVLKKYGIKDISRTGLTGLSANGYGKKTE